MFMFDVSSKSTDNKVKKNNNKQAISKDNLWSHYEALLNKV
jgi:hypothetical protein